MKMVNLTGILIGSIGTFYKRDTMFSDSFLKFNPSLDYKQIKKNNRQKTNLYPKSSPMTKINRGQNSRKYPSQNKSTNLYLDGITKRANPIKTNCQIATELNTFLKQDKAYRKKCHKKNWKKYY